MSFESSATPKRLKRVSWLGLDTQPAEARKRPSFVIAQIDGLSEANFQRALRAGRLPFLNKMLREKRMEAGPWRALIPTSTAAFQTGLFYGNYDRIPGFFWFDRKKSSKVRMNNADDTASVEAQTVAVVAPYPGLLHGGSSYSALFTGGASNTLLTFSRLFSPRLNISTRSRWIYLFALSQVFLVLRLIYYSAIEVALSIYDFVKSLISPYSPVAELKFLFPRIASVVFCREIATLAAILDIYRGVGPIYLNYFSYDEHAHYRGPSSRYAYWTLKGLDASIRRIWKATQRARKMGIRSFDLLVMSDHGQVRSHPFYELFEQQPDQHFDLLFRALHGTAPSIVESPERASRQNRRRRAKQRSTELIERQIQRSGEVTPNLVGVRFIFGFMNQLARKSLERDQKKRLQDTKRQIHLISTGPVAHMCLADSEIPVPYEGWLTRYPKFLEVVAQHEGIGFALCRTKTGGCKVGSKGEWVDLSDDAAIVRVCTSAAAETIRKHRLELHNLAVMEWAGDFVICGYGRPDHRVVSYSIERGSHGGPSPEETTPFLIVPAERANLWRELSGFDRVHMLTLPQIHDRLQSYYCESTERNAMSGAA